MSHNSSETNWFSVYLGLGSNLGDRDSNIRDALLLMDEHPKTRLVRSTESMETEPWGPVEQPLFLNAVAKIETCLEPHPLLRLLKLWERQLGRDPEVVRYGPRLIDIDILLFENRCIDTAELTVPHERMTERRFVLQQLLELSPELVHPRSGVLLSDFLRF